MKKQITNYTFNKTAKTVTFTDYTTIRLDSILLITNVTDNIIIYNFADSGGIVSGNVLTLTYDTSSMSDGDSLQIFYDDMDVQPASEGSLTWMKALSRLLKPLSIVTGGGSNRLSIDVNNITAGALTSVGTVTTVTTTTTVGTVTNQVNMGSVSAFTLQQALLRNAFANGIRANIKI